MSVRRVCRELLLGAWWTSGHAGWRRRGSACTEWRGGRWRVAAGRRETLPRACAGCRTSSKQPPAPRRAPPPRPARLHAAIHTPHHHALAKLSPTWDTAAYTSSQKSNRHKRATRNITCQFMLLGCRQICWYRGNKYPLMGPVALISQLDQGANITTERR